MTHHPELRQFRMLYRLSLARIIDLEIISSRGDLSGLTARAAGILGGLSLTLVLLLVSPYWRTSLPLPKLTNQLWNDEEFLISLTLAAAGMFSVLAWNNVLPDRRDCLVLGTLPVRTRTIALARLAAIMTCIGLIVVALNAFVGLTFPYVLAVGAAESLRSIAAWWITVLAAGVFVFSVTLAVQGAAAQVFQWRTFLRVSAALQLVALFAVSALLFMTPPFALTMSRTPELAAFFPSFWFTGLLHFLKGDHDPALTRLALTGIRNMSAMVAFGACVFALSWIRNMRRIIEAPEIASRSGRTMAARCGNMLVTALFRRPLDRAIILFTTRTAARSKQHRLLLAAYGGIGTALALTFARGLVGAVSGVKWNQPNGPLLVVAMIVVICVVSATRSVFALPHSLSANWIFRITAVQSPAAYFNAVLKSFALLSVAPACMVCAAAWLAIWPGRFSIEASIVLLLAGFILAEYRLYRFRKIPFACSWLPAPGQSVNMVRAIAYGFLFLAMASVLAAFELWGLRSVARFCVICGCLAFWLAWLRRRGRAFASAPGNTVQFEEIPEPEIFALDLRTDSAWSGEQTWVEPVDSNSGRAWLARLQTVGAIVLLLFTAGFIYEKVGEWQDRKSFPRIGRAVDIGERSLNLYCAGSGSPSVVMESGGNLPGYSWKLVEDRVSGFTRACWYDRAGYGWSDPAPSPRSSADIAHDLHQLLHAAGVAPPYLLVGHSFGGFTVRVFASRYREETAGLVLVDSASEHQNDGETEIPRSLQPAIHVPELVRPAWWMALRFFVHDGGLRLLDDGPETLPPGAMISEHDVAIVHALRLQPKTIDALLQETKWYPDSIRQVLDIHHLGNMPLIVLTAGKQYPASPDPREARLLDAYLRYWVYTDQPRMLALSSRSRQIVVQAGHGIPYEAPGAVVDAVREVVAGVR